MLHLGTLYHAIDEIAVWETFDVHRMMLEVPLRGWFDSCPGYIYTVVAIARLALRYSVII